MSRNMRRAHGPDADPVLEMARTVADTHYQGFADIRIRRGKLLAELRGLGYTYAEIQAATGSGGPMIAEAVTYYSHKEGTQT